MNLELTICEPDPKRLVGITLSCVAWRSATDVQIYISLAMILLNLFKIHKHRAEHALPLHLLRP